MSPSAARPSRPARRPALARLTLLAGAALALGCDGGTTDPARGPLAGLVAGAAADSTGAPPPPGPGTPTGTGYARGTVLGPSAPGAGNDSLATAPRVAHAVVHAYPVLGGPPADPVLGPLAAADTTGMDGQFTLPAVPAGSYAVTITPPAASPYGGVWVSATLHATSHEFPWWIVLWRR